MSHRSRLASFYTRTDQPQPINAIGPDLRCVHGATSRAALSSCARCRTIALSRPPAPPKICPGSCCAPPHATASDRTPCRCMFAKRHREDRIDVSFHGSGSVACEDRDGACPFGGSSTPVTGPAGRWPPSQLWATTSREQVHKKPRSVGRVNLKQALGDIRDDRQNHAPKRILFLRIVLSEPPDIPAGDADRREHVGEQKRWGEARQAPKPLRYFEKEVWRKLPKRT